MNESTDSQLSTPNSQLLHWFAVRVSYSRELALKAILDEENIESFIPMRYGIVMKGGKRVRKLVPAIHNLVFIHSTRKRIDALKDELEGKMPIRFIMNCEYCRPVVIPDAQMARCRFMLDYSKESSYHRWCLQRCYWRVCSYQA